MALKCTRSKKRRDAQRGTRRVDGTRFVNENEYRCSVAMLCAKSSLLAMSSPKLNLPTYGAKKPLLPLIGNAVIGRNAAKANGLDAARLFAMLHEALRKIRVRGALRRPRPLRAWAPHSRGPGDGVSPAPRTPAISPRQSRHPNFSWASRLRSSMLPCLLPPPPLLRVSGVMATAMDSCACAALPGRLSEQSTPAGSECFQVMHAYVRTTASARGQPAAGCVST